MDERSKNTGENITNKVWDFNLTTKRMEAFPVWRENIRGLSEDDRKTLTIYRISDKKKFYISTSKEDPNLLVAKDEKDQFILDGEKWEIPSSTLEILTKTKPPASGRK